MSCISHLPWTFTEESCVMFLLLTSVCTLSCQEDGEQYQSNHTQSAQSQTATDRCKREDESEKFFFFIKVPLGLYKIKNKKLGCLCCCFSDTGKYCRNVRKKTNFYPAFPKMCVWGLFLQHLYFTLNCELLF